MNKIHVIGFNGTNMMQAGREALEEADVVVASKNLRADIPVPESAERVPMNADTIASLPELLKKYKDKKVVFLTTGDPLYCGIGGTLSKKLSPEQLCIIPAPTAFQMLFARLGQPWVNAKLCSLHARKDLPWRELLRCPLAAIYGDSIRHAGKLAEELIYVFPEARHRRAAVGCNLGLPDEEVITGTLEELAAEEDAYASLSVLALLPDPECAVPDFPLGLSDDHYHHYNNMITHPEVRAIVLSKLRPAPGIMWDLGAGSGSVGLEAAGLCPDLQVHSVEKDSERFEQLKINIDRERIENITSYEDNAADLLDKLPRPNRIFIGGGTPDLIEKSFKLLAPGGRMVVTAVMLEKIGALNCILPEFRDELLTVNISRSRPIATGGSMLQAENPITVGVFVKPAEEKK